MNNVSSTGDVRGNAALLSCPVALDNIQKSEGYMEIRTAICDDLPTDREIVCSYLNRWAKERGNSAAISMFSSAESFLFQFDDNKAYDLLLLDIEMNELSGVELAKRIREVNREVQIIFISGYNEYISDGYEVEALNYILKPVNYEKLAAVLDKAADKIKKNERAIFFELNDGMVRVPLYEIVYIEVRANYITVHTPKEEFSIKTTLSKIEKELDSRFFRTNRSYLVNLRYVRRTSKTDVTLLDGTTVPLSRGLYEPLNQAFIRNF